MNFNRTDMSVYFAANEEFAWRMAERGIAAESIHVCGIPIMPVFAEQHDRSACAAEFGLNPDNKNAADDVARQVLATVLGADLTYNHS